MTVVEFEEVVKRFGDVVALDSVSLEVERGTTLAVLGPNGAGKSTLIALLLGLRRPDGGRVRLLGGDPTLPASRRGVGCALQDVGTPATIRVEEIVRFVAAHFPSPHGIVETLGRFGLTDVAARQAGGLSGGQRRRLGLALAFVGRPPVVVLDEPTGSLDPEGRAAVWQAVRTARAEGGTVIVATHDLHEAEAVATRVVIVDRGRVVADGSVDELKARAGTTRVVYRDGAPPRGFPGAAVVDGTVRLDVADAGAAVAALVDAGVELHGLEVRPLTLEEAVARLRREQPCS
jgi:ABC-2 type transport system ATP-binding protein